MHKRGRYYHSLKEYERITGKSGKWLRNNPSIHVSGSVRGMRKQFWGYECDVVRVGNYIYALVNRNW